MKKVYVVVVLMLLVINEVFAQGKYYGVKVTVVPPEDTVGCKIIGYGIEYRRIGSQEWESYGINNLQFDQLYEGKRYEFRAKVYLHNSVNGFGEYGESVIVEPPIEGSIAKPITLVCGKIVKDLCRVKVTIVPPNDIKKQEVGSYLLEFRKKGTEKWTKKHVYAERIFIPWVKYINTDFIERTLQHGTTYEFRVKVKVSGIKTNSPMYGETVLITTPQIGYEGNSIKVKCGNIYKEK